MMNDANDFINVKTHAREKPLLARYGYTKKNGENYLRKCF